MTVALIGAFEFFAKVYYGDPRVDTYVNAVMLLFPNQYTLGEALKVLRYGMPLILQGTLLMMDFSFDVIGEEEDDPTAILTKICDRQQKILTEANDFLEQLKEGGDASALSKEAKNEKVTNLYNHLIEFNKNELCAGIGEALDNDDKKKNEESVFVKIFKMIMSVGLLFATANYLLFGPEGFKIPKY